MINVDAGQVSDFVAYYEFQHANDAFSVLFAAVIGPCGQMLDEAHSFGNFDLLLFCQLGSSSCYIGSRMVHWH